MQCEAVARGLEEPPLSDMILPSLEGRGTLTRQAGYVTIDLREREGGWSRIGTPATDLPQLHKKNALASVPVPMSLGKVS